jgi:hypothetical protein
VADDAGNTIWRIAAADGSVTPEPVSTDRVTIGSAAGGQREGTQAPSSKQSSRPQDKAPPKPAQMEIAPAALPPEAASDHRGAR